MAMFHTNVLDNQIKALPTVSTASGSVVTFDTDMTENLVEVECEIVYSQASGTPSPSNPLLITTFFEMNVIATGKNLFDKTITLHNGYVISSTGAIVANTAYTYTDYIKVKPNTDYVFSGDVVYPSGYNSIAFYDENKTFISRYMPATLGTPAQFTTPNNAEYIRANFTLQQLDLDTIQLEYGTTATTYEPYGTTHNIPFGQTVAKGKLNVTTGVLEITHGYKLLTGASDETWYYSTSGGKYRVYNSNKFTDAKPNNLDLSGNIIKPNDTITNYPDEWRACFESNKILLIGVDSSITSSNDWKTFLTNNNLQVVYELATHTIVQLSSNQVQALLNENNIWCDTGDTSVKFILSVGKYVNQNI